MNHLPMIIFVVGVAVAFLGLGIVIGVGLGQRMEWARSQEAERHAHAAVALPATRTPRVDRMRSFFARAFALRLQLRWPARPGWLRYDVLGEPAVYIGRATVPEPVKIDRTPWTDGPAWLHHEGRQPARHAAEPDEGVLSTTGEFWLIVAPLLVDLGVPVDPLALPCTRCAGAGATHEDCPGCACPCTLAAVTP